MEKVLIKYLKLSNFKGIKEFEITDFNHGIAIFGDNASGKTTVFDAFNWLLFGKDSLNSAIFEIKTIRPSGEPVHNLDHCVEASLETSKGEIKLKKIYREKYVKRRGEAKRTFSGHTVDHFVDDVPCQQKEYNAVINTICNEENFKLLTNPRYFNEVLHWTDRRRLILDVCGDVPDQKIIDSDPDLASLPDILGKRTIEQQKKVISAKMNEINGELDKIPTRIDERHKMIVEVPVSLEEIDKVLEELKETKRAAEKAVADAKAGGGIPEKERALDRLEGESQKRKNALDLKISERQSKQRKALGELEKAAIQVSNECEKAVVKNHNQQDIRTSKQATIKNLTKQQDELRARWIAKDSETFVQPQVQETCPVCGQNLPADQIDETLKQAERNFNIQKVKDLEKITDEGTKIGNQIKDLEAELKTLAGEIKAGEKVVADLVKARDLAVKEYDDLKAEHQRLDDDPPEEDDELNNMLADIDIIRHEIKAIEAGNYETVLVEQQKLDEIEHSINSYGQQRLQVVSNEQNERRIVQLEADEKRLAGELEDLESQLFTIENFIRAKVKMLEEKVKAKFKYATFRMFTENINGGLEECCDTTFGGVPYTSMNNGARINVGLDICNTLSNHYGVSLPLFIDNSEAITKLFKSEAQQIRLYVSEADKQLRIEKL